MPIQQLFLGSGGALKTYMDEVFSTHLYTGNETARSINNGLDLAGEGGMIWNKNRSAARNSAMHDSARGVTCLLKSNDNQAEYCDATQISAFNSNGFSPGTDGSSNRSNENIVSWGFRKAPGFFDVVTYTGNDTNRTIAHSLGCIPGMILIKGMDAAHHWQVYHRDVGNTDVLKLNDSDGVSTSGTTWNNTSPTATHFSIGTEGAVNSNGQDYVAYLFAGGESTATGARSIDFSPNDHLTLGDHADYRPGTGDFTLEAWIKPDSTWSAGEGFWHTINGLTISKTSGGNLGICTGSTSTLTANVADPDRDVWTHVAVCRSGSTIRMFYNGTKVAEGSNSVDYGGTGTITTGHTNYFDGTISNLRFIKGTALYTSSFRPPTEPLTSVTNTKLLCCNQSSLSGATTSSVAISVQGCTAVTDSPFDDPAAFTFGKNKEGIVKCGSYKGNGSTDGPRIDLGWEPQWIMIKGEDNSRSWYVFDSMRGMATDDEDSKLMANENNAEESDAAFLNLTPRGFRLKSTNSNVNADHYRYVYIAIRRPDGYVGKPPDAGTDVFAMDVGNSSSTIPCFDSGFPVDLALLRQPTTSSSWYVAGRIIRKRYLFTDTNAIETDGANFTFDSNAGWSKNPNNTDWQSWMWKRHAGFDMVTYDGTTASWIDIPHSLNAVPEMIWVKCRTEQEDWRVYHKGLNGGTSPEDYWIPLNTTDPEADAVANWNDTAPTSTHFTVGNDGAVNNNNRTYLAMLFSSVSGISKVGYYDGSDSAQTISLGFQPRFVAIRAIGSYQNWIVLDTVRGWGSGSDQFLQLDHDDAQSGSAIGAPTSTGMSLDGNVARTNDAGSSYIYYAHA